MDDKNENENHQSTQSEQEDILNRVDQAFNKMVEDVKNILNDNNEEINHPS
ncbi:hypothetical protein ACE38V_01995 [Cytobacillus sp. Hz8]|uniref:hypothetical protein n=1 Tax=Cytobacillus sp. Hz8 TaxID=3347168 RepID=UPI0035DD7AB8